MKRITWIIGCMCAVLLAACSNEEAMVGVASAQGEVTITASIGLDTRTYVEGTQVKWYMDREKGVYDSFYAFSEDGMSSGVFTLTGIDENGKGTFTGKVIGNLKELKYAVYPADQYNVAEKILSFPAKYTYPNSKAPMFGTITSTSDGKGISVSFNKLLSGMVRIPLNNIPTGVTEGTLTLTAEGIATARTLKIDENGEASLEAITDATAMKEVTLSFTKASSTTEMTLDLPIPGQTYSTITVALMLTNASGSTVKSLTESITNFNAQVNVVQQLKEQSLAEPVEYTSTSSSVSAEVNTPGTLETISETINQCSDVTISGTINSSDIKVLREWASTDNAQKLDLTNVMIKKTDDDEPYYTSYVFDWETGKEEEVEVKYYAEDNKIGDYMFQNCTLSEIILPSSITAIGDHAFDYCANLKSVTIPDGLETFGKWVFNRCENLESIVIPNSVTDLGYATFNLCHSLKSAILPNGLTSIGDRVFDDCQSLESISIPETVTSIGSGTFWNCISLTEIKIPENVETIGSSALSSCSGITSIKIPDKVTTIESYLFSQCSKLVDVTLPSGLTKIDGCAFEYCTSLQSLTIPDGVTEIGMSAFAHCDKLETINIPDGVTSLECVFHSCPKLKNLKLSDSLKEIEFSTFYGCESLTSMTIPGGVQTIGRAVFMNCKNLETVICEGATEPTLGAEAFSNISSTATLYVPATAFENNVYSSWEQYFGGGIKSFTEAEELNGEITTNLQ